MDEFLVRLLTELNPVTYVPIAAGAVIFLTQATKLVYKKFAPAASIDYGNVAMIWQLVLWLIFTLAVQFNLGDRFESIAQIIEVIGPMILGLFGSSVVTQQAYQYAHKKATPGVRLSSKDIKPAAPVEAVHN